MSEWKETEGESEQTNRGSNPDTNYSVGDTVIMALILDVLISTITPAEFEFQKHEAKHLDLCVKLRIKILNKYNIENVFTVHHIQGMGSICSAPKNRQTFVTG